MPLFEVTKEQYPSLRGERHCFLYENNLSQIWLDEAAGCKDGYVVRLTFTTQLNAIFFFKERQDAVCFYDMTKELMKQQEEKNNYGQQDDLR